MASRKSITRAKAPATTSRKSGATATVRAASAKRTPPASQPAAKQASAKRVPVKSTPAQAPAAPMAASPSRPTEQAAVTGAAVETGKSGNKLVRDSFTIPKREYTLLQQLKERAAALQRPARKSEVLRAGIGALSAMTDEAFLAVLASVPSLKTGRPKQRSAAKAPAG